MSDMETLEKKAKILARALKAERTIDLPDPALSAIERNQNKLEDIIHDLPGLCIEGTDERGYVYIKKEDASVELCNIIDQMVQMHASVVHEKIELEDKISEMIGYDPFALKSTVDKLEREVLEATKMSSNNSLLQGALPHMKQIMSHAITVKKITSDYSDVYKAIIKPIREEGKSGINATKWWAVGSIIASTVISLAIPYIIEFIKALNSIPKT